jgi:hypothetical protein
MRGRPGTARGSKSAKKSTRSKSAPAKTGRAATKKATKKAAKKALTKKKVTRKTAAPARKKSIAKKSVAKKSVAKKSAIKKIVAKKQTVKRTPRTARKEVFGEGNYTASREFRDQETKFVRRNKSKIESMGEEAEAALEGAEGGELEQAEEEARSHSHSPGD